MRILVAGSRDFQQRYRIDRALGRASRNEDDSQVITIGSSCRRGAEYLAREYADDVGWMTENHDSLADAEPDLCLAFLVRGEKGDIARVTASQAEKAGIPVWKYFQ